MAGKTHAVRAVHFERKNSKNFWKEKKYTTWYGGDRYEALAMCGNYVTSPHHKNKGGYVRALASPFPCPRSVTCKLCRKAIDKAKRDLLTQKAKKK